MSTDNFTGYILAGGKSSRMGQDKAFLKIGGVTFLEKAIETLIPNCREVKVVLNKSQKHLTANLSPEIEGIFDVYENRGALGGIHTALSNCQTRYAVILAVDLPFVTSKAIVKLVELTLSSNKYTAAVSRQTGGQIQPLCAVYNAKYSLRALEHALEENPSASVRDFLDQISTRYINQDKLSENENLLLNINNPEDYESIKPKAE